MNIFPLSAFKDNYIWVINAPLKKWSWVVDPGDAAPVIDYLQTHHFSLKGILLTHHHHDHSGGISDLLSLYGELPVYGSHISSCAAVNRGMKTGDKLFLADFQLNVLDIPGHTLDHVAFYNNDLLFSGDTLFSAGCGRVFEGTPAMMYESLLKLFNLNADTKMYCGHEYTKANLLFAQHVEPFNEEINHKLKSITACTLPSTLRDERKINPFFRCDHPDVIKAVESYANKQLQSATEVFKYLREWKNTFAS